MADRFVALSSKGYLQTCFELMSSAGTKASRRALSARMARMNAQQKEIRIAATGSFSRPEGADLAGYLRAMDAAWTLDFNA
jgi:hypothetical protein